MKIPNNPFFSYGSVETESAVYPVALITLFKVSSSEMFSVMITASPFECDDVTFRGDSAERMASFICASHIPHIIPSIFTTVLNILITIDPLLFSAFERFDHIYMFILSCDH